MSRETAILLCFLRQYDVVRRNSIVFPTTIQCRVKPQFYCVSILGSADARTVSTSPNLIEVDEFKLYIQTMTHKDNQAELVALTLALREPSRRTSKTCALPSHKYLEPVFAEF